MTKAVLDTNVIVSGVIREAGPPGQILRLLFGEQKFTAVTSLQILAEVRDVLNREKIRKYHGWTDEQIETFLAFFYAQSEVTKGELTVQVIAKDPSDDKFLACAREGSAEHLVSGNDHLLELKVYEGVQIASPAIFLMFLQST